MPNTERPDNAGKPRLETQMPRSDRNQLDADAVGGRAGEPEDTDATKRDDGVGIANENNVGTE